MEKSIIEYYMKIVDILHRQKEGANNLFESIIINMLLKRESHDYSESKIEDYERLFVHYMYLQYYDKYKNEEEALYQTSALFKGLGSAGKFYMQLLHSSTLNLPDTCIGVPSLNSTFSSKEKDSFMTPDLLNTFDYFSNLKTILREGWIRRNVDENYQENDSHHTLQMFILASLYYRMGKLENLDVHKVMDMVLVHEVGESIIGDTSIINKRYKNIKLGEQSAVHHIFEKIESGSYFIDLWETFEKRETEEAKFVYQLDKLDPVLKAVYLDEKLDRSDLTPDFYFYEKARGTFGNASKWGSLVAEIENLEFTHEKEKRLIRE